MQAHQALIDGRPVQYSLVSVLIAYTPMMGNAVLPHREGQYSMAICRECGFGTLGMTEEQATHFLLATMNGARHEHAVNAPCAHLIYDPRIIDHIYEAFDPEGAQA